MRQAALWSSGKGTGPASGRPKMVSNSLKTKPHLGLSRVFFKFFQKQINKSPSNSYKFFRKKDTKDSNIFSNFVKIKAARSSEFLSNYFKNKTPGLQAS